MLLIKNSDDSYSSVQFASRICGSTTQSKDSVFFSNFCLPKRLDSLLSNGCHLQHIILHTWLFAIDFFPLKTVLMLKIASIVSSYLLT